MGLSKEEIEKIGIAVLDDFERRCGRWRSVGKKSLPPQATPIELLAANYLGLTVTYAPLPTAENVWGVTAYRDTEYSYEQDGAAFCLPIKKDQVVLSSIFAQGRQTESLHAMYRFTLAHECAHHILFRREPDDNRNACLRQYATRKAFSARELKTIEDWNEWQANVLAAVLLMPPGEIRRFMEQSYCPNYKIYSHGGLFSRGDRWAMQDACNALKVSRTALKIRLEDLGYLKEYRDDDYLDSLGVLQ